MQHELNRVPIPHPAWVNICLYLCLHTVLDPLVICWDLIPLHVMHCLRRLETHDRISVVQHFWWVKRKKISKLILKVLKSLLLLSIRMLKVTKESPEIVPTNSSKAFKVTMELPYMLTHFSGWNHTRWLVTVKWLYRVSPVSLKLYQ